MKKDPWTDPDPQPGDFDEFLESIDPDDPEYVERQNGSDEIEVTYLPPGTTREDVHRLVGIAVELGVSVEEVLRLARERAAETGGDSTGSWSEIKAVLGSMEDSTHAWDENPAAAVSEGPRRDPRRVG